MAWLNAWRTRLSENGLKAGFIVMLRVKTSATSRMPLDRSASAR